MKKILTLTILFCCSFFCRAQTTISTTTNLGTVFFFTGDGHITFAVRNNNSYPIVVKSISNLQLPLYDNNVYNVWYSFTSLSGAPVIPSADWTQIGPSQPFTTSAYVRVTPFDCIGVTIPAGQVVRFAVEGSKGSAYYGSTSTPNSFSSGGVDLLIGNSTISGSNVGYFTQVGVGSLNPRFFDGSITYEIPGAYTDLQIQSISKPNSVCASTSNVVSATLCNKSPQAINFATNNVNINFGITGTSNTQTQNYSLNAGSLAPCNCITASITGVNFSSSGTYTITATASIAGTTDINLANNTLIDSITNYKPIVSGNDSICQFSNGAAFAGFSAYNCKPRDRTFNLNVLPPTVATVDGTSDATASSFAVGTLPLLPSNSVITGGTLLISNLACVGTSLASEARFNIYGASPNGASNPFLPGLPGSPIAFSVPSFEYSAGLTASVLNAMYTALGNGGQFNIGYWESVDNNSGVSDISLNGLALPTTIKIIINYTIQPQTKWFNTASGGSAFFNGSYFNPFLVVGSGISSTNSTGTTIFYAACSADTLCRVPVSLKINASPIAIQDSIFKCELNSGSSTSSFDLNSITSVVSNNNSNAVVSYYQDVALNINITNLSNYVSSTNFIFSKVSQGGCFATDSVYLVVNPKPEFSNTILAGFACAPNAIDINSILASNISAPAGTDTFFYADPLFTTPFINPHQISIADTVYMLLATNTNPVCADTAEAHIDISPSTPLIVNQTTFNTSQVGSVGCNSSILVDGVSDTIHNAIDCRRVAAIKDIPNGVNLGLVNVCEDIDGTIQNHNGQPYVNRHYQITAANNDSAMVCLYYLDDDLVTFNANNFGSTWPLLPTSTSLGDTVNVCFAKVDNGDLNTTGHTVVSIPNTSIHSSYDPISTVWTFCFYVNGFSYFYLHSQNPSNIPLPVEAVFTGLKQWNTSELHWTTTSETNNDHFVIERSKDGINYSALSSKIVSKAINGNSTEALHYSFTDKSPFNGHNYYRLKQYDVNLRSSINPTIVDLFYNEENMITVYPNPVTSLLNVEMNVPRATQVDLHITDAIGRVVRSSAMALQAGFNKSELDLQTLSDGIYIVHITNEKGINFSEVVKKK